MALTKVTGGTISTTSNYEVGVITATKFVGPFEGAVTGIATGASKVITSVESSDTTCFPLFVNSSTDAYQAPKLGSNLTFNSSTGDLGATKVTAEQFVGNISGTGATFTTVDISGTLNYTHVTDVYSVGVGTFASNVQVGAGISVVGVSTFIVGTTERFHVDADGTTTHGTLQVDGLEGGSAQIRLRADQGDDNNDTYRLLVEDGGTGLKIQGYDGSFQTRITLDTSGNVGIGLTNPSKDFEVYRNGLVNAKLKGNVAGGLGAELILQNLAAADGYSEIQFQDAGTNVFSKIRGFNLTDGSNNGYMALYTASATEGLKERVRISDAGKVGIGTTIEGHASADNLTINDSGNGGITIRTGTTSNGAIFFADSTSGDARFDGFVQYNHGTDPYMLFGTAGDERLRIRSDGNINAQKSLAVGGITTSTDYDLSAIDKDISETAHDIFVYDTRKDSDGGAWRNRTRDTSWYNETLGTSTRGTRKEFPAVAVIVATSSNVLIYDGDDPDMPLWMKFDQHGAVSIASNMITAYTNNVHRVKALNGTLLVGMTASSQNEGLFEINFITDRGRVYRTEGSGITGGYYTKPISERNSQTGFHIGDYNQTAIISQNILAIDMAVLPNAPIDKDTGLPRPSYAVGTDSGATILSDPMLRSNYFNSSSAYRNADLIQFTKDGGFIFGQTHDNGAEQWMYKYDRIRSGDNTQAYHGDGGDLHLMPRTWDSGHVTTGVELYYNDNVNQGSGRGRRLANKGKILATYYGLTYIDEQTGNHANGMVAYATTNYHTGWMHGDIKLATLADADTTTPVNLVNNGTFDSGTGWTLSEAAAPTITGGKLVFDGTSGTGFAQQAVSPAQINRYETYDVTLTVTRTAGSLYVRVGNSSYSDNIGTTGTHTVSLECNNVPTETVLIYGNSFNGTVDDISVKRNIQDFSKGQVGSKRGLQTFGTVSKAKVATGADLVYYSGWSSSNYLRQPYNSNLDFGSDDWSFNFWVNPNDSSSGSVLMSRWSYNVNSSTAGRIGIYFNSGNVRFDLTDDGASSYQAITGTNGIQDTTDWHMVNILRRGDNAEMWVDGKLDVCAALTSTSNGSYSNSNAILEIGHSPNMGSPDSGIQLALIRISASAPSEEQIKKMYHDEKVLFSPNAKCTIYGTSSDVNAISYDDGTGIIHAGTGQGRSEFNGFVRINNTTDAIATALSSSNGLVAEE